MPDDDNEPLRGFTVRLSSAEIAKVEDLRERLQQRAPVGLKITQRAVILAALERLEAHLAKLEKDRGRDR